MVHSGSPAGDGHNNSDIYVVRPPVGGRLHRGPPVYPRRSCLASPRILGNLQRWPIRRTASDNNHVDESHFVWTLPVKDFDASPLKRGMGTMILRCPSLEGTAAWRKHRSVRGDYRGWTHSPLPSNFVTVGVGWPGCKVKVSGSSGLI
jgi:hypothetical protein